MIQPIADRQESMDDKIISRREKLRLWRETKQSTVRAPLGKKEIPSDTTKHDKENCVNQQSTQVSFTIHTIPFTVIVEVARSFRRVLSENTVGRRLSSEL